ncbi:carbohydrate sulfotransferase 1-like [Mixophyes fleayi]|uniref:carbohydrate sulfotransferase 1-like n=1 Tax=Mixophyes fleayi TaxID=3061075 RepID=UPI003F4DBF50
MMECSWKVLLLMVFTSLGIQYTAIKSFRMTPAPPCSNMAAENRCGHIKDNIRRALCEDVNSQRSKKHILILATSRSGSSFLGQLFNQNSDIFYLFEPLHTVWNLFIKSNDQDTIDKRSLVGAYRDLLHNLYDCDFYALENYIKPVPEDHVAPSLFRSGASNALCSPPVCNQSQRMDERECLNKCKRVNLTLASTACRYKHMAIKTIRIPDINNLRALAEDPRLNLKIIHLVRDPRAVLASRIATFSDYRPFQIWNSSGKKPQKVDMELIGNTCIDYSTSVETGFSRPPWLKGKYMLVRYEDIAMDPVKKANEIYNFVGLEWKKSLSMWIEQNTKNVTTYYNKFTTKRDSSKTAENWRLHLNFNIVQAVQQICNKTLSQLGYRVVDSVQQLNNLPQSLVEPRMFLPFV